MDVKSIDGRGMRPGKNVDAKLQELSWNHLLREETQIKGMKNSINLMKARYAYNQDQEGVKKISEMAKNMKDISDQLSSKL